MLNSPSFADIVGPLWQTFMTSLEVYVRSSIEGTEDSYDGRYDSDGADKSLDSFVIQVVKSMTFDIDRLLHVVSKFRFGKFFFLDALKSEQQFNKYNI